VINEAGAAIPTHNFKEGQFAGAAKSAGEALAESEKPGVSIATHGCLKRLAGDPRLRDFWDKGWSIDQAARNINRLGPWQANSAFDDLDPSQ